MGCAGPAHQRRPMTSPDLNVYILPRQTVLRIFFRPCLKLQFSFSGVGKHLVCGITLITLATSIFPIVGTRFEHFDISWVFLVPRTRSHQYLPSWDLSHTLYPCTPIFHRRPSPRSASFSVEVFCIALCTARMIWWFLWSPPRV